MKRVRCKQDAFLRDFYKEITLLVIGIVKSRKNTNIAKYITLRISVTRWDKANYYKLSNSAKASSNDFIADLNASFLVRSTPASFKSSTGLSLPPEERNLK